MPEVTVPPGDRGHRFVDPAARSRPGWSAGSASSCPSSRRTNSSTTSSFRWVTVPPSAPSPCRSTDWSCCLARRVPARRRWPVDWPTRQRGSWAAPELLFMDIDPHAYPSQMLGESQRSVARLFDRTIPDLAQRGEPVVVLLDEVEALAVNRAGASLETNPVDVHRATDAVLAGIDHVSAVAPNVTVRGHDQLPRWRGRRLHLSRRRRGDRGAARCPGHRRSSCTTRSSISRPLPQPTGRAWPTWPASWLLPRSMPGRYASS